MSAAPPPESPYAPPQAALEDAGRKNAPLPPRPPAMNRVVILLWISFAINAFSTVLNVARPVASGFGTPSVIYSVISGAIGLAFTAWYYRAIARGRNWARILYFFFTVFAVLSIAITAAMLPLFFRDPVRVILGAASVVLHFYVCWLLVSRPAREWFNEIRERE